MQPIAPNVFISVFLYELSLMRNYFYTGLTYFCLVAFALYWIAVIITSIPFGFAKERVTILHPGMKLLFGSPNKLFTPPYTYNDRLYLITRDIKTPQITDTIEVLAKLAVRKQQRAPCNQKENIMDHLVNNTVAGLKRAVLQNKKMPDGAVPATTDSIYIAGALTKLANSKHFINYSTALNNYCRLILKENKTALAGKEVKIVIKEKMIPPFNQPGNSPFLQRETIVFETPYTPLL